MLQDKGCCCHKHRRSLWFQNGCYRLSWYVVNTQWAHNLNWIKVFIQWPGQRELLIFFQFKLFVHWDLQLLAFRKALKKCNFLWHYFEKTYFQTYHTVFPELKRLPCEIVENVNQNNLTIMYSYWLLKLFFHVNVLTNISYENTFPINMNILFSYFIYFFEVFLYSNLIDFPDQSGKWCSGGVFRTLSNIYDFKPFNADPTKSSNTFKQFVG